MPRKRAPKEDEAQVLLKSRRRCAFCFGLKGDVSEKKGQIAHIDRDPTNSQFNNLAFLCMDHHDQYDSKTRQSKGLTIQELLTYRDKLYAAVAAEATARVIISSTVNTLTDGLPRVLVFEDSSMDRLNFARALDGRAELIFAVDVQNPKDVLIRADPDLIILDLNIDGSPAVGIRILATVSQLTNAPIVICSKYVSPDLASSRKWFSWLNVPERMAARVLPKFPFPTAEQLLEPVFGTGSSR